MSYGAGGTLERHKPTVERMQKHYDERGVELNEARLRMATLPYPATQVRPYALCPPAMEPWSRGTYMPHLYASTCAALLA